MPTPCNIAQHGAQTNATCCAKHVGTTLHGVLVSVTCIQSALRDLNGVLLTCDKLVLRDQTIRNLL